LHPDCRGFDGTVGCLDRRDEAAESISLLVDLNRESHKRQVVRRRKPRETAADYRHGFHGMSEMAGPVTTRRDCDTPGYDRKRVVGLSRSASGASRLDAPHPHENDGRIGVLFAQLGTPDAPTPAALRRYLRQFLSDRRVVERNRVLWWFILRLL